MAPDDAHTSHNHGFELPNAPVVVVRNDTRPWRAVAGVALCLGLAGVVAGLVVAHRQRSTDARITSDALQREELREGWKALGAAAAQDARDNDVQPSPAATAAAPPNVVIVNVPAQSAAAVPPNAPPPNVTNNINVPSGSAVGPDSGPTAASNMRAGTPIQSMPPINFSPGPGYLPAQTGTTYSTPTSNPQSGYFPPIVPPPIVYGTTPSGAAPYAPPVGNGSIPGSTPNPALPNNSGLVGSTPTPGLPNGTFNGSSMPSTPTGAPAVSPGTPSLPSGFSAP
jgi:hypothetical protein